MHKPDGLVADNVRDALDWDNAVDDARIMVQVKDGKVTLNGAVHTYAELLKAVEDTKHCEGRAGHRQPVACRPRRGSGHRRGAARGLRQGAGRGPVRAEGCRVGRGARRLGHPHRRRAPPLPSAMPPRTRSAGSKA